MDYGLEMIAKKDFVVVVLYSYKLYAISFKPEKQYYCMACSL